MVPVDEDGLARRAGADPMPRFRRIGADSYVFAAAEVGRLVARRETKYAPERGDRVSLRPKAGEAHLFDPATGVRLA